MTRRILVWDLPTRVFHWLLALSFAGAYFTGESERWALVHVSCGYTLLGLVVFRVFWGLAGTRYARFCEFVSGPSAVIRYVRGLIHGSPTHCVGHNPVGALAIVALLSLGLISAISGWMVYEDLGGDSLEEVHEAASSLMLGVVLVHIGGVLISSFEQSENLVRSMIDGRKRGELNQAISKDHAAVAVCVLAGVIGLWIGSFNDTFNDTVWNELLRAHHQSQTEVAPPGWLPSALASAWSASADYFMTFTMWATMMVVMMLPSVIPMVLAFARGHRRFYLSAGQFLAGYFLVWLGFCAGMAAVQEQLQAHALLSPFLESQSLILSAGILLTVGLYEFVPWKAHCLDACRVANNGMAECHGGALRVGLRHGLYCVGSCWALMSLSFAVGIMNALWMGVISTIVFLEKVMPIRPLLIRYSTGLTFLVWGSWSLRTLLW